MFAADIVREILSHDDGLAEAHGLGHSFLARFGSLDYAAAKPFLQPTIERLEGSSLPEFREAGGLFSN